jgi:hypothetical protein
MKPSPVDPSESREQPPEMIPEVDPDLAGHDAVEAPSPSEVDRETFATRGVMSQGLVAALFDWTS